MSISAGRRRARELLEELKDTTPEERREVLRSYRTAVIAEERARPVPRWLGRTPVRRSLAVLIVGPVACGAVAAFMTDSISSSAVALAGGACYLVSWLLLRRATRQLAEVPDTALDEREVVERAEATRTAYVLQTWLMFLLTVTAIADSRWIDLEWHPLLLGALMTATGLPMAVAAWRWRDLDDE